MTTGPCRPRALGALALVLAAMLVPAQSAFAEGSANFNTGADAELRTGLMGYSNTNAPYWHGYTVLRVYAGAGETIQMGSSAIGLGGSANILLYAPGTSFTSPSKPGWRATFPDDPVFDGSLVDCVAEQPGTGRIESRAQELAGPLPSSGGYTPCQFTAPSDGVYAVVMTPYALNSTGTGGNTVGAPVVTTSQQSGISIWDVTVRSGEAVQGGRAFTNIFNLSTGPFGTQSKVTAYVYTPAGHVYRLQLYKPQAGAWDLAVDGTGVVDADTGEPIYASYRWGPTTGGPYPPTPEPVHTEALAPQMYAGDEALDSRWPIFVQPPSPVAIGGAGGLAETRGYATAPMAPEGGLSQALSFVGAGGQTGVTAPEAGGTIEIDAPQLQGLDYSLAIDLDADGGFGGGADLEDSGTLGTGGNSFAWNGRDADGALVPCGTYAYQATSSLPSMHVVQADTEALNGIEFERLTLPGDPILGDPKLAAYNDVNSYTPTPVTNAVPSAVAEGTSGPLFHGYTHPSGQTDFVDNWTPVREVSGTGTIEVRCPTANPQPGGTPPESSPSNPQEPKQTGDPKQARDPKPRPGKARLVLEKDAGASFARPGSVVAYRITVANRGDAPARKVVVCDHPPASQRTLRTEPAATGKAKPCWKLAKLAPGAERTFTLTAMVEPGSERGTQRNRATATAANVKGVRADTAAVGVKPLPDSGCLTRPLRAGILAEVEFLC